MVAQIQSEKEKGEPEITSIVMTVPMAPDVRKSSWVCRTIGGAGEFCASTGSLPVIRLFARTMAMLSVGELGETFDAFNPKQTRKHYFDRIARKTASLVHRSSKSATMSPAITVLGHVRSSGYCRILPVGRHFWAW